MKLMKGKRYLIAYLGIYDYDAYRGYGVYTGMEDLEDAVALFEFELPDGDRAWFPLDAVFEVG